jgi:hypothetical protein
MNGKILLTLALANLTGCTTTQQVKFDSLNEARKSLAKVILTQPIRDLKFNEAALLKPNETEKIQHDQADEDLTTAFREMLSACQEALNGFEKTSTTLKYTQVGMAIVGSLVGGVAIPALSLNAASNAVAIAALGGVSGATNALQGSMTQEGLTSRDMLQTRQKILDDWKNAISDYYDVESTPGKRLTAINRGLAACTLYSITLPIENTGK